MASTTNMLECSFKKYLGHDCPGCGAQRSFIELLDGNLVESLNLFPALIPLLFTFIYLILHLVYKFKHGANILIVSFSTSAFLMAVNFILKLI